MDPATIAMMVEMGMKLIGGNTPAAPNAPSGGITIGPTIGNEGMNPSGEEPESKMQAAVAKANVAKNAKKGKTSFDDKLQMAALAAQLGGLLAGPGAPPPPGAPRGGGMGMQPVFQNFTARNLYGG